MGVLGYGQTVEHLMAFIPWPKFDTFFTTEKPPNLSSIKKHMCEVSLSPGDSFVTSPCRGGGTAAGLFLAIYTHVFASWLLWRQTRQLTNMEEIESAPRLNIIEFNLTKKIYYIYMFWCFTFQVVCQSWNCGRVSAEAQILQARHSRRLTVSMPGCHNNRHVTFVFLQHVRHIATSYDFCF